MDPVAFYIFGFPIRWYALAYVFGILGGVFIAKRFAKKIGGFETEFIDYFINYAVLGIIIGGRLGHVFFYEPYYFFQNPVEILKVWHGGMSFHGGLIGIIVASLLFCRKHKISFLRFCDVIAIASPFGLFLGRIANFINGELFGRATDCSLFAIKCADGVYRHPSQLYEAFCEGVLLFFIVLFFGIKEAENVKVKRGLVAGVFCIGYAVSRIFCEIFREPDSDFNYELLAATGITLGQLLSLPILLLGWYLIRNSKSDLCEQ